MSLTIMNRFYTRTIRLKFETMKVHYLAESGLAYARAHIDDIEDELTPTLALDGDIIIVKKEKNLTVTATNGQYKSILNQSYIKKKSGYIFTNWKKR